MDLRRVAAPLAGSIAAVAAATGLIYALRPIAPTLSLGVVYTLAVLAVSIPWGPVFAVVTAVASMLTFNFLLLPPVHTFALTDARNWTALAVYLVTGLVASRLAAGQRRRAAEAEQREREAAVLADTAAALLREASVDELRDGTEAVLAGADAVARARFVAAMDALLALAEERRAAEEVRRSDAVKTTILQSVSHDFRTPIATIQAAVGGLQSDALELTPADRAELLETIRLETARLARLAENVLDVSRLQAGVATPHPALWSIDDLVGQAALEVSDPGRVRVDVSIGLATVRVDAGQLQRALVNLVENALKFASGAVEIRAVAAGERVAIEVLDRGPGPAAEPGPRRGLGLGLAIARGFAAANGGEVELGARAGGGSAARILLPRAGLPAGAPP
jgi:two-component system sensor histidine kinase KdpD